MSTAMLRPSEVVPESFSLALVEALAELRNPIVDEKANVRTDKGSFSYTYASLPAILDLVRPVLAQHGLGLTQDTITDGAFVGVITRIHHVDGGALSFGPLTLPAGQNAQTAGSAITYARRYSLCAALGIAADEDDDGKQASAPPTTKELAQGPGSGTSRGETGTSEPGGAESSPEGGAQAFGEGAAASSSGDDLEAFDETWTAALDLGVTVRDALQATGHTKRSQVTERELRALMEARKAAV